jgi:NhaP-type Na+/H+ or K+/H+ antiporter
MFSTWCLIIGVLLMLIGLSDTWRQRMPVSTSALYLIAGYLLGPQGFGVIDIGLPHHAGIIEIFTEVAVLISLFAVGLRLRVGLSDRMWLAPVMMATFAMVLTIAAMVGVGVGLGLTLGGALLLASILAPTDPVLASDVQVVNVKDQDRLRFSLTGEGGLNDGAAFPFVMLGLGVLGLHELGPYALRWWTIDVAWATLGGLALGWALGIGFSRAVVHLRHERRQAFGMESFLTLGLIALTYGLALSIKTYGFLAVFAAGLAVRHIEHRHNVNRGAVTDKTLTAADKGVAASATPAQTSAYMAKAVLDFALDLERLAELTVMLVLGALLTTQAFTTTSVIVALALIFVVRPIAIYLATIGTLLTRTQRRLAAWFGIRGISSVYYLAYALTHGATTDEMRVVTDAVLVTIAVSVLLHGSSATPIMELYRNARGAAGRRRS